MSLTAAGQQTSGVESRHAGACDEKPPRVPPAAQIAVAGIRGPRVLPGAYTVRMTKRKSVRDETDGRARSPRQIQRSRSQSAVRCGDESAGLFGDESALMDRILACAGLAKSGRRLPEGDPLRKQITDFDGKVDAVRKQIVATTEGGAITGEERLREHTDQLYGAILSYEGKPADYQIAYIEALKRELDDVTKQFDQLAQDLPH